MITHKESNELDPITKMENTVFMMDTLRSVSVMDSVFSQSIYTPNTLNQIPGEESNLSFKLLTDTITIQGVEIEVMEIACPVDVNPKEKPDKLKIGSLESASLAGNWN